MMRGFIALVVFYLVGLMLFWLICELSGLGMRDFVSRALDRNPDVPRTNQSEMVYSIISWAIVPFCTPFMVIYIFIDSLVGFWRDRK